MSPRALLCMCLTTGLLGLSAATSQAQSAAPWTGVWKTTYGDLTLTQDGASITGSYQYFDCAATVSGTVSGNVFSGRFVQCSRQGDFQFTLSTDQGAFTGQWNNDGSATKQSWDGTRIGGPASPPLATTPTPAGPACSDTGDLDSEDSCGGTGAKPPAFGPSGVISIPSAKKCVSRRAFKIRIRKRKGRTYVSASVFVNGKRVRVLRGRSRLTAGVNLRGLPKGRFTVKIIVITTKGEVIQGTRRYRTCTKKLPSGRRPRL